MKIENVIVDQKSEKPREKLQVNLLTYKVTRFISHGYLDLRTESPEPLHNKLDLEKV